jgi:hypothetical protein
MKKSLETIVQSIVPERPEKAVAFADFLSLQHDEENQRLQHGNLYVVYDFSTPGEMDTSLVTKVVTDVLHNTYFSSQSASPIQPLEKAALELKEKLVQLSKEYNQADIDFNIVMCVVWGEVLYIVSYGKCALYLMRENLLKELDTVSEGNFSIASGLVKDMDVVFLSTQYFVGQFTPDTIFKNSTPINQSQLEPKSAAAILKFNVTTEFSENETLDIINPSAPLNIKRESDKKAYKLKKGLLKLRPSQTSRKKKIAGIVVFLILASLFGISVYALSQSNKEQKKQEQIQSLINRAKQLLSKDTLTDKEKKELKEAETTITNEATDAQEVKGVTTKIEEALNLKRVDSILFYDLAIVDKNVFADEIVYADEYLFVSDNKNGKLYSSLTTTAKFTLVTGPFADIDNLGVEYYEDDQTLAEALAYTSTATYNTFVLETLKEGPSYKLQNPALIYPYLDFVYEVDGTKITKYTKGANGLLSSAVWTTDENLEQAVSITIDGSVYILLKDGLVKKYTSGDIDEFELTGLDVNLLNPSRIITTSEFENIYILDAGNDRVVVFDKDGKFVSQIMDKENRWTELKDMTVSADESTLYVLNGSKVFEVSL